MIAAKAIAVVKKDVLTAIRYRNGFVLATVAQLAQLATFYFLSRAVGPQFRPDGMPYFLFLLVGTGAYTFLLTGIHTFLQTIQESQQTGTLEVLMTTATAPPVLLALSAISAFAGGFLQLSFNLVAGFFLFSPALHVHVVGGTLVFLFSTLTAIAIGLFAAGLQVSVHKGSAALWLLGSGAWLISGTLFPVAALPRPLQIFSCLLPFTHSLNGMRLAFLLQNGPALTREVEILALFAFILMPSSVAFFSWTVRRARQFGTLAFY